MTFTTGLAELVQKNLVSGAARLMDAWVTLISLTFGGALALGVAHALHVELPNSPPTVGVALWLQATAALLAGLSFALMFSVPRALLWTAIASCATAFGAGVLLRGAPPY